MGGGWGCRASQSLLLHFIRQQTHRQSGTDGDRGTAFSDNQHNHSTQREVRERGKENVTLIDRTVMSQSNQEQKVKKEWSSVQTSESRAHKGRTEKMERREINPCQAGLEFWVCGHERYYNQMSVLLFLVSFCPVVFNGLVCVRGT